MKTKISIYRPNLLKDWTFITGSPWVTYDTDLNGRPATTAVDSGTDTSGTSYQLNETGQNFLSTVVKGYYVNNTSFNRWAKVTSVASNTQLLLDGNIMGSGDSYVIRPVPNANTSWSFTGNQAVFTYSGFDDYISQNVLIPNVEYTVKMKVSGLSGSFRVYVGPTVYHTVSTNGFVSFTITAEDKQFRIMPQGSSFSIALASVVMNPITEDLDLTTDVAMPFTFSVADIKNPSKRQTTWSKTIVIPGTKKNNKIFGDYFEVESDSTFNVNKKINCVVNVDDLQVFAGIMQLNSVDRNGRSIGDISYNCVFIGNLIDLFSGIGEKNLSELDFSEYKHTWNLTEVRNSWTGVIKKNGSTFNSIAFDTGKAFTISKYVDSTGARIQLTITAHGYTKEDELHVSPAAPSPGTPEKSYINGYHSIYKIIDANNIVLNYDWDSLYPNPNDYVGTGGTVYRTIPSGEGYVYPLIDYDNSLEPNGAKLNNMFPAIYAKTYVDKIFEANGFTYDSDFFDSSFFKRLIVPFNQPDNLQPLYAKFATSYDMLVEDTLYNDIHIQTTTYGSGSHPGFFYFKKLNFNTDITTNGPSTLWDISTSRFIAPTNISTSAFDITLSGNVKFQTATSKPAGVYIAATGPYYFLGLPIPIQANVQLLIYDVASNNYVQDSSGNTIYINVPHFQGYNAISTSGQVGENLPPSNTIPFTLSFTQVQNYLQAGKQYEFHLVFVQGTIVWKNPDGSLYTSPIDWEIGINVNIGTGNSTIRTSNVTKVFGEGSITDPTYFVPPNIKQKDFLMDIINMFNLYVYEDKNDKNKLIIESRDAFYGSGIVDWTEKLDTSKQFNLAPLGEGQAISYTFDYKSDSDDLNSQYVNAYKNNYGYDEVIMDNDFAKDKKEVKLNVFSPSPLWSGQDAKSLARTMIGKQSNSGWAAMSHNPRILFYGMRGVASNYYLEGYGPSGPGGNGFNVKTLSGNNYHDFYPYAGHLDNPMGPKWDLNFGYPSWVRYNTHGWTDANLFNRFWSKYIVEVSDKDAKQVTAWIKLTARDISDLDFRKLYVLDGHYLRLNKIYDWDPNSNASTKVDFVKVSETTTIDWSNRIYYK